MKPTSQTGRCFAALPAIVILSIVATSRAPAQTFSEISTSLPPVTFMSASLGDMDNDGQLELLLGTRIYHADGAGGFTNVPTSLPTLGSGRTAWADFDNDGFIDVAVAGELNPLRVYRNDHGTNFILVATIGRSSSYDNGVAWGDYDNDGRLDLAFADAAGPFILHNDGNGQFTDIHAGLPALYATALAWADYDNDGRLDFILAGQGRVTWLYHNEGGGVFRQVDAGLPGVDRATATWGDYDNDGRLDLLLCGFNPDLRQISRLYHNEGNGAFTDTGFSPGGWGAVWCDYNNDGRLDIFAYGPPHKLFRNEGNGVFVDSGIALPGLGMGTMAWGDYDNDGVLDLLLTGDTSSTLLRNAITPANPPPNPPTGLLATVISNRVDLSWAAATDANQAGGFTYNIRIGTAQGLSDVLGPMADASTGLRRVPALGNVQERLSWSILNLPRGIYYWSVQAIDHSLVGSVFAPEQSFAVTRPVLSAIADQVLPANGPPLTVSFNVSDVETPADSLVLAASSSNTSLVPDANLVFGGSGTSRTLTITAVAPFLGSSLITVTATDAAGQSAVRQFKLQVAGFLPIANSLLAAGFYNSAVWGDYDNDGRLDAVIYGYDYFERLLTQLYHNDSNGQFSPVDLSFFGILGGVGGGSGPAGNMAWGDYDNDGDLDLLVSGQGSWGLGLSTHLYRNDGVDGLGKAKFMEVAAGLPASQAGTVSWGDFNRDGWLDVLFNGNLIYVNDGHGHFSNSVPPLPYSGSAIWLDFDNDGWPDVVYVNHLLHNERNGTFREWPTHLPDLANASAAWGDFNNDGLPDLLLSGALTATNFITAIYRNEGSGNFTDIHAGLPGLQNATLAWADFDNDGWLDLSLSGEAEPGSRYLARFFHNNHDGTFTDTLAEAPASTWERGQICWADADGDGNLDALILSVSQPPLFRNYSTQTNRPPSAPADLGASQRGNLVTLHWSAASDPNQTAALTYNVRVGRSSGGVDILSPMSDLQTGFRRLAEDGNAGHALSLPVSNLPEGTYYWSVQAVDHGWMGSPFAPEASFVVEQFPVITRSLIHADGTFEFEFTTVSGRNYSVESSADLQTWTILQTLPASGASLVVLDPPKASARQFFRVCRVP